MDTFINYLQIILISILNKSLLCVPIHITHQYSQQIIIMYCTHPYYSSVFSTNHYYVLYPSIFLISILNKPLLCIVPIHITHKYSQQIIIMYCTHPYYSSVFSTNHYYVLYPSIFLILVFLNKFSTNHYYVLYPSILLISILNKPLLCIVPIHITHKCSQQTIIMYCTHPYFSSVFSTNHYYVLYPSILLISILNKPLLCIVPIHISHKYSQQTIIMYCTHPYFSSVFSTNHYYVLYPSILLISILNKPLLCIVPIHISHQYSQQTIIMYCTHPYISILICSILNKPLLCIVPIS